MKKTRKFDSASLRTILIAALIIAIGASCYGFYIAQNWLKDYATTVEKSINGSKSGDISPESIASLNQALSSRQTSIDKAAAVTISSANYQSQAISDLNTYASKTNITITDFSTTDVTQNSSTLIGVIPKYIKITLQNPTRTESLLQFLSLIETNLPKMQPTGISLNQASTGTVNVDPLTIELYTE
jgi:hypothetical protein